MLLITLYLVRCAQVLTPLTLDGQGQRPSGRAQMDFLTAALKVVVAVQSIEETGVGVSWYKTDLPQGQYESSWGEDGVREVVKQFAGDFTLRSGGKVR